MHTDTVIYCRIWTLNIYEKMFDDEVYRMKRKTSKGSNKSLASIEN